MTGKRFRVRLLLVLPVVLLATVGGLLASGALASRKSQSISHYSKRAHFSVFEHHSKRARTAAAVEAGAVLAAVRTSGGVENEIYVSHEGTELCLSDNEGGMRAEGCGSPSDAEEKGLEFVMRGGNTPLTMVLLVPDGVETATFIDKDGSEHTVAVTDDVVVRTDSNLSSVQFVMPGERPESDEVPVAQAQ